MSVRIATRHAKSANDLKVCLVVIVSMTSAMTKISSPSIKVCPIMILNCSKSCAGPSWRYRVTYRPAASRKPPTITAAPTRLIIPAACSRYSRICSVIPSYENSLRLPTRQSSDRFLYGGVGIFSCYKARYGIPISLIGADGEHFFEPQIFRI